ncbi:hypothetical protein [Aureibacter tunicatorum]|uniref:Lipoprotein n=1 Tax=Aureibacter tunicatorum TaxID=866807 RepID=A0AAE4BPZ0_9BACT|nr:hypothetical protein [Aureibacter tunicatorum]MDR6238509.1 hypothetical protein [Aureibacter tunicatorum]BDD05558.1 hypothetical protein AUTU_30410 [Aureibacter tunicatorum]
MVRYVVSFLVMLFSLSCNETKKIENGVWEISNYFNYNESTPYALNFNGDSVDLIYSLFTQKARLSPVDNSIKLNFVNGKKSRENIILMNDSILRLGGYEYSKTDFENQLFESELINYFPINGCNYRQEQGVNDSFILTREKEQATVFANGVYMSFEDALIFLDCDCCDRSKRNIEVYISNKARLIDLIKLYAYLISDNIYQVKLIIAKNGLDEYEFQKDYLIGKLDSVLLKKYGLSDENFKFRAFQKRGDMEEFYVKSEDELHLAHVFIDKLDDYGVVYVNENLTIQGYLTLKEYQCYNSSCINLVLVDHDFSLVHR